MKNKIEKIIIQALLEINDEKEDKFEINENLILMGNSGVLDSMDLVNLTVLIEEKLFDELGLSVTLASEMAFSRKKSPFYNVESLKSFTVELAEMPK